MDAAIPSDLLARFAADLGVHAGTSLAVAVSGGPDSLALLLLAHGVAGARITALTVDHGLRAESAAEARFVAALSADLGVAHHILPVIVEASGDGPQAAARAARYEAMGTWCAAAGIGALLTAHHADDQAETVLMRLARGAGVGGLAGIRRERPLNDAVTLVRPLLGWKKAELVAIVRAAGVDAVDDPSNRSPRYDRTAVRALLAESPLFDPARIAASASHLAEADAALDWATARALADRLTRKEDAILLNPADLPAEIVRRMLVTVFAAFGPVPDGPSLARLGERLAAGSAATLGGVKASPGAFWRFAPAPPRRGAANGQALSINPHMPILGANERE